ncbi:MAG: hypothetical protein K2G84_05745 [Muribaculaceae bacterium]|nr:hypothetical protein [Muribaculaceae bacterium]
MNTSFSVTNSDVIFVNVMAVGRQVMTATLSGIASIEELMEDVRNRLADMDGLLTVNLRNSSQGTSAKRVLRLRKPSSGLLRAQMKGYAA